MKPVRTAHVFPCSHVKGVRSIELSLSWNVMCKCVCIVSEQVKQNRNHFVVNDYKLYSWLIVDVESSLAFVHDGYGQWCHCFEATCCLRLQSGNEILLRTHFFYIFVSIVPVSLDRPPTSTFNCVRSVSVNCWWPRQQRPAQRDPWP